MQGGHDAARGPATPDEYVLPRPPSRVRVVTGLGATAAGVFVVLAFPVVVGWAAGARVDAPTAWVIAAVLGSLAVAASTPWWLLDAQDRARARDARRRVLGPPDPPDAVPAPGVLRQRLHTHRLERWWLARAVAGHAADLMELVADQHALDVPGWVVDGRPRGAGDGDRVRIPWASITRLRVTSDSEGSDVWVVRWADARAGRPARPTTTRLRRSVLEDEVALLDHVRAVGRVTVELESPPRRPRAGRV